MSEAVTRRCSEEKENLLNRVLVACLRAWRAWRARVLTCSLD